MIYSIKLLFYLQATSGDTRTLILVNARYQTGCDLLAAGAAHSAVRAVRRTGSWGDEKHRARAVTAQRAQRAAGSRVPRMALTEPKADQGKRAS